MVSAPVSLHSTGAIRCHDFRGFAVDIHKYTDEVIARRWTDRTYGLHNDSTGTYLSNRLRMLKHIPQEFLRNAAFMHGSNGVFRDDCPGDIQL